MSAAKQRHRRRRRRRLVWGHRGGLTGRLAFMYSGTNRGLVPRRYVIEDPVLMAACREHEDALWEVTTRESPMLRLIREQAGG